MTKSRKRLKALYKKLEIRNREVWKITEMARKYNIELPSEVVEKVIEWDRYLRYEKYKINDMMNVRFNDLYRGGYGDWAKIHKPLNGK